MQDGKKRLQKGSRLPSSVLLLLLIPDAERRNSEVRLATILIPPDFLIPEKPEIRT